MPNYASPGHRVQLGLHDCVSLTASPLLSPVVFCMSFVQADENNDKIPVALGLKEKNLYLSCVMKDSKPTLQLEVSEHQG